MNDSHNPTFYDSVVHSPEWELWIKECEKTLDFDVHESMECGWLSPKHFAAFLNFVKKI